MLKFKQFISETLSKIPGTQMGSNDGGVHVDTETGEKHYVKSYDNPDQGKVEALTGKLYNHLGIKTLDPEEHNGTVSTKWNEDLRTMRGHEFEKLNGHQREQIGRMYHAAVASKNWDVVGLSHDNIMMNKKTGDLHAIDHGGAFHFRAQGGPKPYGPDIAEHSSLRNSPGNASSHVFGHVFAQDPHAEIKGLQPLKDMDHKHVHNLFKTSGLNNWESLHANFMGRREAILKKYGK